jgi:hypothetical protein
MIVLLRGNCTSFYESDEIARVGITKSNKYVVGQKIYLPGLEEP